MPQGKTYVKIASQTSSSAFGAVTFSNLPQNYTDLYLVLSVRANATPSSFGTGIRFNSDTGSNYSRTVIYGYGSVGRTSDSNQTRIFVSSGTTTTSQFNVIRLNIMNYSNGSMYKTVIGRNDDKADVSSITSALWRNTSPITSITVTPFDDNATGFAAGTTLTIYGIECAKSPKAEGGDKVYSTGTYWVHEFYNSGIFVPRVTLTADCLVVAGGGAGGNNSGGGGGAGGFLTFTSQSLTVQAYTVTIGAGGVGKYDPTNGSNSQFGSLTAAVGGGRGGGIPQQAQPAASTGGSGGGGATVYQGDSSNATGAAGTSGQGYAGGTVSGNTSTASQTVGAGGGGSSAVGANATVASTNGGNGGAGTSNSYSGTAVTYAGGGGGGAGSSYSGGSGGSGGGGNGGSGSTAPVAGTANTGGGGGGGGNPSTTGASGGSGIVIVRYAV